jgi:hypothetical protein
MSYFTTDSERRGGVFAPVRPLKPLRYEGEVLSPESARLSPDHPLVRAVPDAFEICDSPLPGQDPSVVRDRVERTRARLITLLDSAEQELTGRTRQAPRRRASAPRPARSSHRPLRLP